MGAGLIWKAFLSYSNKHEMGIRNNEAIPINILARKGNWAQPSPSGPALLGPARYILREHLHWFRYIESDPFIQKKKKKKEKKKGIFLCKMADQNSFYLFYLMSLKKHHTSNYIYIVFFLKLLCIFLKDPIFLEKKETWRSKYEEIFLEKERCGERNSILMRLMFEKCTATCSYVLFTNATKIYFAF